MEAVMMNNKIEPALPPMHEKAALQDAIIEEMRRIVDLWNDEGEVSGQLMDDLTTAVRAYDEWVIHWTEVWRKRNGGAL